MAAVPRIVYMECIKPIAGAAITRAGKEAKKEPGVRHASQESCSPFFDAGLFMTY
jgi:hypothetical protein